METSLPHIQTVVAELVARFHVPLRIDLRDARESLRHGMAVVVS